MKRRSKFHLPEVRSAAAGWVIQRERGLSATEAGEYELWLAADECHRAALQEAERHWRKLDQLGDDQAAVMLRALRRQRWWRRSVAGLSLAAACLGVFWIRSVNVGSPSPATEVAAATPRALTLPDGTRVQLNAGAVLRERFLPAERRVELLHGEAHFSVVRDPDRPFFVVAGDAEVRAVGTAFNVVLGQEGVEVIVTEGVVKLSANHSADSAEPQLRPLRLVNSGHRAVITRPVPEADPTVLVTHMDDIEISRALAWHEPLMRLGGATLAEVVAGISARTGRRIELADPDLADLQLGGRLRGDDIEAFTALLANTLELEAETASDGTIILRRKFSRKP